MDDLIKLVRTYRVTSGLPDRLGLAERILPLIEPDLRFFVFGAVRPPAAEDVFQEVLKAVVTSLGKFKGNSTGEFWAWCYRIARNKINDQFGRQAADRLLPMPDEELWQLVETSVAPSTLSAADRHDLEYALKMLARSKPECREYLWNHFVFGLDYGEIAQEQQLSYDSVRMKIGRCMEAAQALVS
jgi:RNA polymerase sigma factor (sigma-70 family)